MITYQKGQKQSQVMHCNSLQKWHKRGVCALYNNGSTSLGVFSNAI